jgi:hypothetical protein
MVSVKAKMEAFAPDTELYQGRVRGQALWKT